MSAGKCFWTNTLLLAKLEKFQIYENKGPSDPTLNFIFSRFHLKFFKLSALMARQKKVKSNLWSTSSASPSTLDPSSSSASTNFSHHVQRLTPIASNSLLTTLILISSTIRREESSPVPSTSMSLHPLHLNQLVELLASQVPISWSPSVQMKTCSKATG